MSTTSAASSSSERVTWTVPGDAFVARRLREILEPGERAGATCRGSVAGVAIVATANGIARVDVVEDDVASLPEGVRDEPGLADIAALVARCTARWEPGLEALPLEMAGTAFQLQTWSALRRVAAGRTITCARLAELSGRDASSAGSVARAVEGNPLKLLVPCHRVVADRGVPGDSLKRRLLLAEGTHA